MSKPTITMDQLLNLYLETKDKLGSDINPELEVKFGTRGIKSITKIDFDNVIQQLLSNNFKLDEDSQYYLRATTTNKTRIEIIGLDSIREYCKTNNALLIFDID